MFPTFKKSTAELIKSEWYQILHTVYTNVSYCFFLHYILSANLSAHCQKKLKGKNRLYRNKKILGDLYFSFDQYF